MVRIFKIKSLNNLKQWFEIENVLIFKDALNSFSLQKFHLVSVQIKTSKSVMVLFKFTLTVSLTFKTEFVNSVLWGCSNYLCNILCNL